MCCTGHQKATEKEEGDLHMNGRHIFIKFTMEDQALEDGDWENRIP
jgi:hypothetical protein